MIREVDALTWCTVTVNRSQVTIGQHVLIVLKKDQSTGKLTEGYVKDILTKSTYHPRGIKVRLDDWRIGRVQKILD